MGYTTNFEGKFSISPVLEQRHQAYLEKFAEIRHMKRDISKINKADPLRTAVDLPLGEEGMYFVDSSGCRGQTRDSRMLLSLRDSSIIDYNNEPDSLPGLWCQWVPNSQGTALEWDGGEKFYDYVEWLQFLITHFFAPWGYTLNGEVEYEGEDNSDFGKIIVVDNIVTVKKGRKAYD